MSEAQPIRPGRNDRCHCGSGKKYKQCCLAKDTLADREARAEAAAAVPTVEAATQSQAKVAERRTGRRKSTDQPWKRSQQQAPGFQKRSGPRKRGGS